MGAVLGGAQAGAVRRHVQHPWRWVIGSVLGWTAAMPVIYLGATVADHGSPLPAVLGLGAATGVAKVQVVPSHDHVSFLRPLASRPPNNTTRLFTSSHAIACSRRGDGDIAGTISRQSKPSHSQVSPNNMPPRPPNRTIRFLSRS